MFFRSHAGSFPHFRTTHYPITHYPIAGCPRSH
jgi:hypothetical protein